MTAAAVVVVAVKAGIEQSIFISRALLSLYFTYNDITGATPFVL